MWRYILLAYGMEGMTGLREDRLKGEEPLGILAEVNTLVDINAEVSDLM